MTITITGGVVSVEDGTKSVEEYAPARKVRVEIHYDGDGEENLTLAGDLASAQVDRLLGRPTPGAVDAPSAKPRRTTKASATPASTASQEATPGPQQSSEPSSGGEKPTNDPLGDLESAPEASAPAAAEPENDPLAGIIDEPAEEAVVYTDKELITEIQAVNKDSKNPNAIRALVESFNPDPEKNKAFQVSQIPADQRASFVEKLKAIKPV